MSVAGYPILSARAGAANSEGEDPGIEVGYQEHDPEEGGEGYGVPELRLGRLMMDEDAAGDHAKEASESCDDRKAALAQPLDSRSRRELSPYQRAETDRGQGGEVPGQRPERVVPPSKTR